MTQGAADLRSKIDGAGDLQSVVRTMKALAASNIGQYEKSVHALADYYTTVQLGLSACLRSSEAVSEVVQHKEQTNAAAVVAIVFGSDQGLVGRFNEVVADHAMKSLTAGRGQVQVWAVGERVHARLTDAGLSPKGLFTVPTSVKAITPLVGHILVETEASRSEHEVAELHLFFNRSPTPGVGYEPASERLLPLDADWRGRLAALRWPTASLPEVIGDRTTMLRALIREYLFISIFRACAESLASENASRLAAMQRAEQNIDELLGHLRGTFQRVRQSSIDEELFDVISGFEALSDG